MQELVRSGLSGCKAPKTDPSIQPSMPRCIKRKQPIFTEMADGGGACTLDNEDPGSEDCTRLCQGLSFSLVV